MTKLRPFDIEAAKAGAKVVTRDGRPARIVCWDAQAMSKSRLFPIVAVIGLGGAQIVGLFAEDGSVISGDTDKTLLIATTPARKVPEVVEWLRDIGTDLQGQYHLAIGGEVKALTLTVAELAIKIADHFEKETP